MFKKLTPNLMVEDVAKTLALYRNILGFELVMAIPNEEHPDWAMMKQGDVEVMFQSRKSLGGEIPALKEAKIGGSFTMYVDVEGIDELYEKLKGKTDIVQDMHKTFYGSKEFAIRDANGYVLAFSERT